MSLIQVLNCQYCNQCLKCHTSLDDCSFRVFFNGAIIGTLRHLLQYWQLRTWINDNLCYLTINCDTGQHSQFLRCFYVLCHVLLWNFSVSFLKKGFPQHGFYSPIKAIVSLLREGLVTWTLLSPNNFPYKSVKKITAQISIRLAFRKVDHWSSHVKTEKIPLYPTSLIFVHNI